MRREKAKKEEMSGCREGTGEVDRGESGRIRGDGVPEGQKEGDRGDRGEFEGERTPRPEACRGRSVAEGPPRRQKRPSLRPHRKVRTRYGGQKKLARMVGQACQPTGFMIDAPSAQAGGTSRFNPAGVFSGARMRC